ncbi:MAG: dTMP kinase [Gemmatimonadales bacterium]|nr:dTMP kinase [Gemmatimonadales bacterium]
MTDPESLPNRGKGLLITFEGPEGSGKTTLIRSLAQKLDGIGATPVLVREPGGTAIGEQIRNILLDLASEGMCAETELLLMVASRAQLIRETIRPALAEDKIVLCDRFADASVAYQGFGRGLGTGTVHALNAIALGGLQPDLTLLCLLPPHLGRMRLKTRITDRLDRETVEFHERVFSGYLAMSESDDSRFRTLDASAAPEVVMEQAVQELRKVEHRLLYTL